MKTIKFISVCFILFISLISCVNKVPQKSRTVDPTKVAVFYTSDDAGNIAAAAAIGVKYTNCRYFDIDGKNTSQQLTMIQTLTDSVHRAFILVDTATVWADNKLTGAQYRALDVRLYNVATSGVTPDAHPIYPLATASKTKCEVLWTTLYSTFTQPLVFQYLGYNDFSVRRNISKRYASITDSTIADSTGSLVADAYNGYYLYVISGTGFGYRYLIYDNSTTVYYVSPDWVIRPARSSFVIKKPAEIGEGFYDQYAKYYILTKLWDLSDATTLKNWHKLIDKEYNINDGNVYRATYQDLNYLKNTVIAGGKIIYDYLIIAAS
jgi:hypothetical protein